MNASRIKKATITARILIAPFLLLLLAQVNAQTANLKYNKELADSLGADDYGMKMYVLVILKTGKVQIQNKKTVDSLFAGHLKNINHLAEAGKLVVAGPMKENTKNYEGIFILNVRTVEQAAILLETDPAIKAKILDTELFQWYGSAALPLYLNFHNSIKKKDF